MSDLDRLEHDLETITSPWYWRKRYVLVGCSVFGFAVLIGIVAYLVLVGG